MEYKEYESKIGNVYIGYNINKENEAYMEFINYDPEYVKIFLLTLKISIDDLKKNNVKKVLQKVTIKEWNEYLKNEKNWNLKELNNNLEYCIIECDIENIFNCIIKGFGIYEDHTDYKTIQ